MAATQRLPSSTFTLGFSAAFGKGSSDRTDAPFWTEGVLPACRVLVSCCLVVEGHALVQPIVLLGCILPVSEGGELLLCSAQQLPAVPSERCSCASLHEE